MDVKAYRTQTDWYCPECAPEGARPVADEETLDCVRECPRCGSTIAIPLDSVGAASLADIIGADAIQAAVAAVPDEWRQVHDVTIDVSVVVEGHRFTFRA